MSKTYLVVTGRVADEGAAARYREIAGPVMKKFGGSMPPESCSVQEVLAGESRPSFLLRVEFPGEQEIRDAFQDPDYLSILGDRAKAFHDLNIWILKN